MYEDSKGVRKSSRLGKEARPLLGLVRQVARCQQDQGRMFVIENPTSSAAWRQLEFRTLVDQSLKITVHMCTLGLRDIYSGELLRKTTRLVTNSSAVVKEFHHMTCNRVLCVVCVCVVCCVCLCVYVCVLCVVCVCGPTSTREAQTPFLGHTWAQQNGVWNKVQLSAFARGYT